MPSRRSTPLWVVVPASERGSCVSDGTELNGVATPQLTAQERRVAELVASGLTSRQVAVRLLCSPRTVDNHVAHILRKLDLPTRHNLAFVINSGVVAIDVPTSPSRRALLLPDPRQRPTKQQEATMSATAITVHLDQPSRTGCANDVLRHRLLYLPGEAMVVLPTCRADMDRWHCTVIAARAARREGHVLLAGTVLTEACTTICVEPERDPDGYARLLWPARAFQQWPGGAIFCLVQLLTERLRPAGSLCVPAINLADHNAIAAWLPNTRPSAVGNLLQRLAAAGFLSDVAPGWWRLTLPPAPSHS